MAQWKVSKEIAEVKTHANADALEIVKLGTYQLVSGKGNYKTGDVVILIPEKSVLSNGDMIKEYEKYLTGPRHDRVKAVQLRGEISQGITWPMDNLENVFGGRIADLIEAAPIGEDIAELMGITKYEAPIPYNMAGEVARVPDGLWVPKHDVLQFGAYASEFDPDERVVITEKLHGTQLSYTLHRKGGEFEVLHDGTLGPIFDWSNPVVEPVYTEIVSSKGLIGKDLSIKEDPHNLYWQAVRNSGLLEAAKEVAQSLVMVDEDITITIHGEVIPAQGGYTYGQTKPIVKVFGVTTGTRDLSYDTLLWVQKPFMHVKVDAHPEEETVTPQKLFDWVPVLYDGPLKDVDVYALAKGKETVSGKELHIREGIVVQPYNARRAHDGEKLKVKVINPKYKETGEEFN